MPFLLSSLSSPSLFVLKFYALDIERERLERRKEGIPNFYLKKLSPSSQKINQNQIDLIHFDPLLSTPSSLSSDVPSPPLPLRRIVLDRFQKGMSLLPKGESVEIREVWYDNLEEEFALIRELINDYPYVAMDTEFPGIVVRPIGNFKNSNEFHYQTLKGNVDMLKLIQLGLTLSDDQGNLPTCRSDNPCIWQFNFREFNLNEDVFASDSIELLKQSGIDFKKNNDRGIAAVRFGELLMSSGVVLNDNVQWVTFHSGYDFGYLLKLLTCRNLPDTQAGFFDLIGTYFPNVYDIKHLMKFCNSLHGGLNKLAELLEVERVGVCHQAGSDSLLTSRTFRKLKENFFSGSLEKYSGVLYGLGVENGQHSQ